MNFINNLENNSILIIPNNIRNKILDILNKLDEIKYLKIITFNELKYGLYFDYNNQTINHIMNKYNLTYNIAKSYIDNLYYIEEEYKDNSKYKYLKDIKKELEDNNLLVQDKLFIPLLKSKKKIYVYGFSNINKFNKHLLDKASNYIPYEIIEKNNKDYKHDVLEFKTIEDEVSYIADEISKLISNGVNIDKIYIANYNTNYYFTFNYIFKKYKLPIYLKNETTLYHTSMGKYFLNNLDKKPDELLSSIKEQYNISNKNNELIFNKLKSLLDTYFWTNNLSNIYNLIEAELKTIKVPKRHYKKEIITTDIIDNVFYDDEYVFLINFNLGNIPKLKRDEDYLNDDIKPSIMETTNEYNSNIKNSTISAIRNIKNLTITYKLRDNFEEYEPSFLIDDNLLNKIKINKTYSAYSNKYNELLLAKSTDKLVKFNEKDDYLSILNNTYHINYKTYDNSFNGVDNEKLINTINNKLNFSYSNIDAYYKCPFKFYINSILHIVEKTEETHEQYIGKLFHYCLEKTFKENKDPLELYDEYIKQNKDVRTLSNSEKFFIESLREEITIIVNTIKEQYKHSSHNNEEQEKNVEIEETGKISYKIKGYVDKVLYHNNKSIIIDYKTNNSKVDKELFEYGINIQLPMYLYLLKRKYDIDTVGMYLQHILNIDNKYIPNENEIEAKKNNLKLSGYTFDNISDIALFDDSYSSSEVIETLKMKNDGTWYKNAKILSLDEKEELYKLMEELIYNVIDSVCEGKFDILPIKIDKKCDGCNYCDYKDICFVKPKDFNIIEIPTMSGDDDNE